MTERFSHDELFFLRNHLPIRLIITALLKLNSHSHSGGAFRFECPLCHGFDTATNPATNLARCFACRKNFNPIDLVMAVRQIPFKDAVSLLRSCRNQSYGATTKCDNSSPPPASSPKHPTPDQSLSRLGDLLAHYKITSNGKNG